MGQRPKSGGHGRGGAAAGAARRALRVPGIASWFAQQVVAHILVAQVRRIGLADDDASGGLDALGYDAVVVGDQV